MSTERDERGATAEDPAEGRPRRRGRGLDERSPRHHPGARRLREELRAHGGRRLHVQGAPVGEQAGDPRRRPVHLGRRGQQGQHAQPQGQAPPHPRHQPHRFQARHQAGHRHPGQRARSRCSRTEVAMGIRSRKPTSPARRFQTVSDFSEITKSKPEKSLLGPQAEDRWSQRPRSQDVAPPRRRPQAAVPHHRLQAHQGRRHRQGRGHRVRPEPHVPHRPAALRRRREGLHPRPRGLQRRRPRAERPGRRHQAGQRPAAALHPRRHHRAQRRAAPGPGRQDRPLGRHRRAARRQGRRLRHAAHAVHRDAPRPDRLPGHRRRGRQRRARADQGRQGRPQPLEGRPPADPWRGHEPRRPPARWWRGPHVRWSSRRVAVGRSPRAAPATRTSRRRSSSSAGVVPARVGGNPCPAA